MENSPYSKFTKRLTQFVGQYFKLLIGLLVALLLIEVSLIILHETSSSVGWTTDPVSQHGGITRDIAFDENNNQWVIYQGETKVIPVEGNPIPVPLTNDYDSLTAIAFDAQNQLWVGTQRGLIYIQDLNGDWTQYEAEYGRRAFIEKIIFDQKGQAWIATFEGIWMVDPIEGEILYPFGGLNRKSGVTIDEYGVIWATNIGNLMKLSEDGEWIDLGDHPGRNIAVDSKGRVWGGYSNHVFFRSGDEEIKYYPPSSTTINTIITDKKDRAWIGSNSGLTLIDPEQGLTHFDSRNSGFPGTWAYNISIDSKGNIWIATDKGPATFNMQESEEGFVSIATDNGSDLSNSQEYSPISQNQNLKFLRNIIFPAMILITGFLLISPSVLARLQPTPIRPEPVHYISILIISLFVAYLPSVLLRKGIGILGLVPITGSLLLTYFKGKKWGAVSAVLLGLALHIVEIIEILKWLVFIFLMSISP
jgi:streptogramin lyase